MDSTQYAELFLTESREHVSAINHALLALERGEGVREAVDAVFRAVHTVKGMSATMGYRVVADLSHELETLLDRARRRRGLVRPEVVELLFHAADALEQSIEGAVAGTPPPPGIPELLVELRAAGGAVTPAVGAVAVAAPGGWTVPLPPGPGLAVRVRIAPETPLRGVRAYLVLQAVRRIGDVLATSPGIEAIQAEKFGQDFAFRLDTTHTEIEVESVVRGAGDVADVRIGADPVSRRASRGTPIRGMPIVPALDAPAPEPVAGSLAAAVTAGAEPARAGTAPPTAAPAAPTGVRQQQHVRIELRRLDALMNVIGELVISRGQLAQLAGTLGHAGLTETVNQASRLIGELQDEIMQSRMVPVWQVFDRFPRLVRDAARLVHKEVEFAIEGKEIELDRSMLDEIGDPVVHLLRNAIDHGLETPEVRVAAGKPRAGRLTLSTIRDRSAIVIRVTDDGRGIDREKVLRKAQAAGLVDASRTELSDDELVRVIARAGFSTADRVTDLSGRGVGLDVVINRLRSLGGAVDIRSEPGQGTAVTLRLPLTLAIIRSLLARVGEETYAIPLTHVAETVELSATALRSVQGSEVLVLRDDVLPVVRLRELLQVGDAAPPNEQVVVLETAERRVALLVDQLTRQQEIVVKQFDGVRGGLTLFGGATILGDGAPALILDVTSLL